MILQTFEITFVRKCCLDGVAKTLKRSLQMLNICLVGFERDIHLPGAFVVCKKTTQYKRVFTFDDA